MKKIAILASGGASGGGSGFEKLVDASVRGDLDAEVSCVLSNHPQGGVWERAKRLGVRFEYFESPWTPERCLDLIGEDVDLICMQGGLSASPVWIQPGPSTSIPVRYLILVVLECMAITYTKQLWRPIIEERSRIRQFLCTLLLTNMTRVRYSFIIPSRYWKMTRQIRSEVV